MEFNKSIFIFIYIGQPVAGGVTLLFFESSFWMRHVEPPDPEENRSCLHTKPRRFLLNYLEEKHRIVEHGPMTARPTGAVDVSPTGDF